MKTTIAKSGGVKNTIIHELSWSIANPRKGAKTGVKRNMVKMSDIILAIASPTKRSRTPAIVVMKTADAPTPAIKRKVNINSREGE
jgi:hypothetical protein